MPPKQILYNFCQTFIEGRISRIQNNIRDIHESLTSETKSSAGDKHETGRAMLQLEREKLGLQLAEAEKMVQIMAKVPLNEAPKFVGLGSWVHTAKGDYYMAVSAGEYKGDSDSVFCVSLGTPIGMLLRGKSVGDTFVFNGKKIEILEVG